MQELAGKVGMGAMVGAVCAAGFMVAKFTNPQIGAAAVGAGMALLNKGANGATWPTTGVVAVPAAAAGFGAASFV